MRPLPLDKMPLNWAEFSEECKELPREQRQIVLDLRSYIWRFGFLPDCPRDLAEKVGLTLRRWVRIAPAIAMHFDHDEDGRWRDFDLEEARDKYRTREQIAKESGSRGGQKRWSNLRLEEEARDAAERTAREQARVEIGDELPEGFADGLGSAKGQARVGLGYPSQTLAENGADPAIVALGSGHALRGLTDLSLKENNSLSLNDNPSVQPSSQEGTGCGATSARADAQAAGRVAMPAPSADDIGLDGSKPRVEPVDPSPSLGDGGGTATPAGERSPVPPACPALDGGDQEPDPGAPSQASVPTAARPNGTRTVPQDGCGEVPDRATIIAVLREAAGDRLARDWENPTTIPRVQGWIRDGSVEIEDLAEAWRTWAAKGELKNPANEQIRKNAIECRTRRGTVAIFDAGARKTFVRFWEAYPHKVDRQNAELQWAAVHRELNGAIEPVMDGLTRYVAQKPAGRDFMNPANFLKNRRWEDEAAAAGDGGGGKPRTLAAMRRAMAAKNGGGDDARPT